MGTRKFDKGISRMRNMQIRSSILSTNCELTLRLKTHLLLFFPWSCGFSYFLPVTTDIKRISDLNFLLINIQNTTLKPWITGQCVFPSSFRVFASLFFLWIPLAGHWKVHWKADPTYSYVRTYLNRVRMPWRKLRGRRYFLWKSWREMQKQREPMHVSKRITMQRISKTPMPWVTPPSGLSHTPVGTTKGRSIGKKREENINVLHSNMLYV